MKKCLLLYGYLSISDDNGDVVMVSISNDDITNDIFSKAPIGKNSIKIKVPKRTLGHGKYNVSLGLASSHNINGFNVDSPGKLQHLNLVMKAQAEEIIEMDTSAQY